MSPTAAHKPVADGPWPFSVALTGMQGWKLNGGVGGWGIAIRWARMGGGQALNWPSRICTWLGSPCNAPPGLSDSRLADNRLRTFASPKPSQTEASGMIYPFRSEEHLRPEVLGAKSFCSFLQPDVRCCHLGCSWHAEARERHSAVT